MQNDKVNHLIRENKKQYTLVRYYKGYDHKKMALSVLRCKQSPVKWYYNIWCIIFGLVFIIGGCIIQSFFANGLSVVICVLVALYGLVCEILSSIFPINEDRENQDTSSKIYGIGSVLGFTALLCCPLLLGIAVFMVNFYICGAICVLSFVVALTFFVFL